MPHRMDVTATATLDGAGEAVRPLGGPRAFHLWRLLRATTTTTESDGSAKVRLYRDRVSPSTFLDGSAYARQDVAEYAPAPELRAGEQLIVAWAEGTPGADASVTVTVESGRG